MTTIKQHNHNQKRRGFTLLELLIVISIIAILVTMSVIVMRGIDEQAKEEGTVATIRKINGLLESRVEAFDRAFDRGGSFQKKYIAAATNLLRQKDIYGVRPEVIKILARKVGFRHSFPQRHEDLLKLGFLANGVTTVTDFNGDVIFGAGSRTIDRRGPLGSASSNQIADVVDSTVVPNAASAHVSDSPVDDATVSSELLYWFLIKSGNFGSGQVAADRFSEAEVTDTDGDGLMEFVDAWGNPLRFYRWPTSMVDYGAPGSPGSPVSTFQPILTNLTDPTDTRGISVDERLYANVLMKGLPPAPTSLPNGGVPRDMLLTDPDDPIGRLYAEMERLNGANGKPTLAREYNAVWYHTPETYHTPLIVSSGSDELLGLFEPSDTANGGHIAAVSSTTDLTPLLDNLTNRNRRAGGRR